MMIRTTDAVKQSVMLFATLAILASGCATSRGILDVRIPPVSNPTSPDRVAITGVHDARRFEIAPREPSIPSLKDNQINNAAITSRAIARKRNSYGKALGDILLPEGRTVEALVRETVEKALREKGYSVVRTGGPDVESAVPLDVQINQFWAWATPGFWAVSLEFEAIVKIKSGVLLEGPEETVRGYVLLHTQMAGSGAWMNTIEKGTEDLIKKIKDKLRSPEN